MSSKNPPRSSPIAAATGVVIAVLFIALAVVGIHDLAVTQKWATGQSWSRAAIDGTNGLTRADWVVPLAVVALLLGLVMLLVSLTPRRTTHRHVPSSEGSLDVWIVPAALGKLATGAAEDAPGVLAAHSKVSSRRIRVMVHGTPGVDEGTTVQRAEELVAARIGRLSDLPVKVSVQEVGT